MPAFQNGQRVRIAREVSIFNLGTFPAGETGTVEAVNTASWRPGTVLMLVRLDKHFPDLDEWNNRLQVFSQGDPAAGDAATVEHFAPIA